MYLQTEDINVPDDHDQGGCDGAQDGHVHHKGEHLFPFVLCKSPAGNNLELGKSFKLFNVKVLTEAK